MLLLLLLLPCRPSRQPGGDRVRGGLLGHAVVADHRVEAAPRVGVLGGVVGLQRRRDAPFVLLGGGREKIFAQLFKDVLRGRL